jgi:uncharacterized protein (DUF2249 family)/quercetin dioxygenase-like cupin family protein
VWARRATDDGAPAHPNVFATPHMAFAVDSACMTELDVRELPPSERHGRIRDAFEELAPGETLTVVNDHDPKPLYHEMAAEVPAFDAAGYAVAREGPSQFVTELPKAPDGDESGGDDSDGDESSGDAAEGDATPVDRVRIADLDGEPHADAFPGKEPKTIRLSLDAGDRVPGHQHPDRTVLFHVLAGTVDVALDGDPHRVEAGAILRFEGESAVEPTAREDSTALVVLAPRGEA